MANKKQKCEETFMLQTPSTSPPDQLKVVILLNGDGIAHTDIKLKLPRPGQNKELYHNTTVFCIK